MRTRQRLTDAGVTPQEIAAWRRVNEILGLLHFPSPYRLAPGTTADWRKGFAAGLEGRDADAYSYCPEASAKAYRDGWLRGNAARASLAEEVES